jgi:DNA-binding NarL/FixJ family response regulator
MDRHDREGMVARVLVVDDSAAFRHAAAALLTMRGFAMLPDATDRAAALDIAATHGCPDGALVDVHLPGDDGLDVAAALHLACPSARIVLTSSDVDRISATDLVQCGALAFLPKDELALADLRALLGGQVGQQEASPA